MRLHEVIDCSTDLVQPARYDVAFFASGYEPRCSYIATTHFPKNYRKAEVLGFNSLANNLNRKKADKLFGNHFGTSVKQLPDEADKHIFRILGERIPNDAERAEIFVDYSSMTRLWYSAILSWVRFHQTLKSAVLHFGYAPGRYQGDIPISQLAEISCIPGCEGGISSAERSNAIVGLGFDALSALCVLDKLEPDHVYAFYTASTVVDGYADQAQRINRMILDRCGNRVLKLPIGSVATSYAALAELVSPILGREDITIIPMGPKPHVLASILLAIRFPAVACLYARSADREAWRADHLNKMFVSSVEFRAQRPKQR